MSILRRITNLFHRSKLDQDIEAELRSHIEMRTADNIAAGMSPEKARRDALLRFGNRVVMKERVTAADAHMFVDSLWQDLRYALRMLRKSPGFTTVAILTLALGIGANTAIFSVLNAVLIRSLPYKDPSQLVYIFTPSHELPQVPIEAIGPSNADFFDIQRQAHSFSAITLFTQLYFNLAAEGTASRVSGAFVQPNFFSTFGVSPLFGRSFEPNDARPGGERVAVISHSLWQSAFGGSVQVLGKSVTLDGQVYRVIGVMPASFGYPSGNELPYSNTGQTQVWLPMALTPQAKTERDNSTGDSVARLRPGVTLAQAQAEMNTIVARLGALHAAGSPFKGLYAVVKPFTETVIGGVRLFVWLLFGAVSLVLLIACANAANLLLARAASRTHEMGMRAALGARRARLIRQVLTEALLLACAGGTLGILIACAAIHLLLQLNPGNIPRLNQTSLDLSVLVFAVAISLLTGIVFGILPAFGVSRTNLTQLLKQGGDKRIVGASKRWRHVLIVAEVTLAVVLATGSGLLVRSSVNLQNVSTGFSGPALTMHIALDSRYNKPEQRSAFFHSVLDKLRTLPGVNSVGAADALPLGHTEEMAEFSVEGYPNKRDQIVDSRYVTDNYFETIGTPLVAGRFFTEADETPRAPGVVNVNEAFAKAYFSSHSAIGGRLCMCYFTSGAPTWSMVVGVVANTRFSNLENTPPPQVYQPFWRYNINEAYIALHASLPFARIVPQIRAAVRSLDPSLAVADIQTMDQRVSEASALRRFQTSLFGAFAAVALFLAAIGLYGVMAYTVKQRTPEIGIRLALGAQPSDVLKLIIHHGIILTVLGIFFGVTVSLALTRVLSSLLYGIAPTDPVTIIVVSAVLLAVSLLACYIPARRAMKVDPMVALRYE